MKIQFAFVLLLLGLALSEAHKSKNRGGNRKMKKEKKLAKLCKIWTKRCDASLEKGADKKVYCVYNGESYVDIENTFACIKKNVMVCNKDHRLIHPGSCGQCDEEIFCRQKKGGKDGKKNKASKKNGRRMKKKNNKGGRQIKNKQKQMCDQNGNKYERRCELHLARCQAVAEKVSFADLPRFSKKCSKTKVKANQTK